MTQSQDQDNPDVSQTELAEEMVGDKRKQPSSSAQPPKQKKTIATRSSAWNHFTKLPNNNRKASCNYCGAILVGDSSSGTSSMNAHIKKSCKVYKSLVESGSQKVLAQAESVDGDDTKLAAVGFSQETCRRAVIKMIIMDELPFAFVEGAGFKHFCSIACPNFLIPSRKIVAKEVFELFLHEKAVLKSLLHENKQRVSFTTDIWTSITTVSYMVVTAHFIDNFWRLNRKIISFSPISSHKGEMIARQFEKCLNDWGIDKVFAITVDNASANDSAIRFLKNRLSTWNQDTLLLNGEFMHIRCGAHILNLIVREGLSDMGDSVVSIRNAIKYVRSSDSRLQSFQSRVESGRFSRGSLVLDCTTRWNSTFLMLSSALKYREAFTRMADEDKLYDDYFHEDDESRMGRKMIGPPSTIHWDNVQRLVQFLRIFYDSTLAFSATKKVTSSGCYNEILKIETVLASLVRNSDDELSKMAENMKLKYDKYWEGTEKINKLLILASVFDPRRKMSFITHCFEKLFGKDSAKCDEMKRNVDDMLRRLFEAYHTSERESQSRNGLVRNTTFCEVQSSDVINSDFLDIDLGRDEDHFAMFSQMMADQGDVEGSQSELDLYLMEKVEVVKPNNLGLEFDILMWWKMNNGKFPILARMAKDVLAFPVSTVASESAFSTGGRVLDQYRSCLAPDMVEALVLTQNWLQYPLFSDAKLSFNEALAENDFIFALIEVISSISSLC